MINDFDAEPTPAEQDEMKRLRFGLQQFPLGGQMRSGEHPAPTPEDDQ